jgi:hypothetical protein
MIAGLASIDWGCAVQVMAAASIGSNGAFEPTSAQLLWVNRSSYLLHVHYIDKVTGFVFKKWCICSHRCVPWVPLLPRNRSSGTFAVRLHMVKCLVSTIFLAYPFCEFIGYWRLCLAVIVGLPAATPSEFRNSAKVALVDFNAGNVDWQAVIFDFNLDQFSVTGWDNGYAFILSFLAPLWTIC